MMAELYGFERAGDSGTLYQAFSFAASQDELDPLRVQRLVLAAVMMDLQYSGNVKEEDNGSNCFVCRQNDHYLYQASDISAIQSEIMKPYKDDFCIMEPVSDGASLAYLLEESKEAYANKLGILGVINVNDNHWVSVALVRFPSETFEKGLPIDHMLICKDSLGRKRSREDPIKEIFRQAFDRVAVFCHKGAEQNRDTSDCGIFALENLRVLARLIQFCSRQPGGYQALANKLSLEGGMKNHFCSAEKARALRRFGFARLYVISVYHQICEEEHRKQVFRTAKQFHRAEAERILNVFKQEFDGEVNTIVLDGDPLDKENMVGIEVCFDVLDDNLYAYSFKLSWTEDLDTKKVIRVAEENYYVKAAQDKRFIRLQTHEEPLNFDRFDLEIPEFIPALKTMYENLAIPEQYLTRREEVKGVLRNGNLEWVGEEEDPKRHDFFVGNFIDRIALMCLCSIFEATIVVIRNELEDPEVFRYHKATGSPVVLGWENYSYFPLARSSPEEAPVRDICQYIDRASLVAMEFPFASEYDDDMYMIRPDIIEVETLISKVNTIGDNGDVA